MWKDSPTGEMKNPYFTATDGLFVDESRGLLYVSELESSKLIIRNISTAVYSEIDAEALGVSWLDDFTLTPDGSSLVVASFHSGEIFEFKVASGHTKRTLFSGLEHPTSARFGCLGAGGIGSLFASEGGDVMFPTVQDRRVLMMPFERGAVESV